MWVSVKDEKPENGLLVLITDGKDVGLAKWWKDGRFSTWIVPFIDAYDRTLSFEPTHWARCLVPKLPVN